MISIGGSCLCLSDLCFDFATGCTISWVKTPDTLYQDGILIKHVSTVEKCKMACANNAKCTGIDFHPHMLPKQCYIDGPWSGPKKPAGSVDHHQIIVKCPIPNTG